MNNYKLCIKSDLVCVRSLDEGKPPFSVIVHFLLAEELIKSFEAALGDVSRGVDLGNSLLPLVPLCRDVCDFGVGGFESGSGHGGGFST